MFLEYYGIWVKIQDLGGCEPLILVDFWYAPFSKYHPKIGVLNFDPYPYYIIFSIMHMLGTLNPMDIEVLKGY